MSTAANITDNPIIAFLAFLLRALLELGDNAGAHRDPDKICKRCGWTLPWCKCRIHSLH